MRYTAHIYGEDQLGADHDNLDSAIAAARGFVFTQQADSFAEPWVDIHQDGTPIGKVDGDGHYIPRERGR